jgi:hypothetical protein
VRRSEGAKELIIFLLEIDLEEALFIPIPEEIVEFLDEIIDFPSDLDFPLIFHFFLLYQLSFDLCLEHPFNSGGV